jgi:putative PIN family toxin of toxin-antitoxin system
MNVVLDTNVLVSAVLTPDGPCARILDLVLDGLLTLQADARILAEYADVLRRPEFRLPTEDTSRLLEALAAPIDPVAAVPLESRLPDPDDLPFLEVAAATGSLLVTGNIRHYPAAARGGVAVLSPADLLDVLRRRES